MTGERICSPDNQGRPWAHIEYDGSHTADSFTLEGRASHTGDGGGLTDMRSGEFVISGKRVSHC